jgi:hypothetical protein
MASSRVPGRRGEAEHRLLGGTMSRVGQPDQEAPASAPLDAGERVNGPAIQLRDREAGRVAADAHGGRAFVAWVERAPRGWETRLAELQCVPCDD